MARSKRNQLIDACESNELKCNVDCPFWKDCSFEKWCDDKVRVEFERLKEYRKEIEENDKE